MKIVFDFGGVLFDWNPDYLYRKLIADPAERAAFLRDICNGAWNIQQDAGRSLAEGTEALVREHPQYEALIRAFYDRWTESLPGVLPEGIALFESLERAGYHLYGLTNWSAETFPYAWDNYPFLHRLRDIVVSGRIRQIKPHAPIYDEMLRRIRAHDPATQPGDLVFIDDSKINADAATQFGWHGIHHTSVAETAHHLHALGLEFDWKPA